MASVIPITDIFTLRTSFRSRYNSWYNHGNLKLTAQVKLLVTPEQADALHKTIQQANTVCGQISEWAWNNQTFGQYQLHYALYATQRAASGLAAQMVIRCLSKVADAYKLDKETIRTFQPNGAIAFDDRILNWYLDKNKVSIWTVKGRMTIPFVCGEHQRKLLASRKGESDLTLVNGNFYLMATVSIPEPPLIETDGVLGVDLGIVQIATDSEGNQYSGEAVKDVRHRSRKHRCDLQKKGSKRAKRTLKKVSRKASRFSKWVNHTISKAIVQTALSSRKAIALEDLTGIRERGSAFNREMRWQLGNWAFLELSTFIRYKAARVGIPVLTVDARNTSRTCSACGYCDKANRKSQSGFLCLQCGLDVNADANAALNIEARGASVRHPLVALV